MADFQTQYIQQGVLMHKIVKSFIEDPSFTLIKETENYYIFNDAKTCFEMKIELVNDDKVTIEFKDHFE